MDAWKLMFVHWAWPRGKRVHQMDWVAANVGYLLRTTLETEPFHYNRTYEDQS